MQEQQTTDQAAPPEKGQGESPIGGAEVIEPGDTGKVTEPQGDASEAKPAVEAPASADKAMTAEEIKSYNELRAKMNDQGIKLREYEEKIKSHQATAEELEAYKKWYEQYYPIMNELYQDEALREKIEKGVKPKAVTPEDAEQIAERKFQEFKDQTNFERSIDNWISKHPDVKGDLAEKMYKFLEKNDLTPTPELLETAYVYVTKDKLKEIGAKEKDLQTKKISNASVGGGSQTTPGKPVNPIDDLFSVPVSNFYPGAKL